ATAQVLEEGAELYGIYCEVCHGGDGGGEGPVAEYFRRMPDLSAPYVKRYQDGRLYTIIRQGGFSMPAYASSMSVNERWAVVHYLRTLGETQ
nr:c-type cytochrome [Anaerolineae bacterium]